MGSATPETSLWTAAEVLDATGGAASGNANWRAAGVSIDSRTVQDGDLFFAISGPNFDGHDYVRAALDAGASAAVVSRELEGIAAGAPLVRVETTLDALSALGRAARARMTGPVAAVTGSVGKTGTKEALRAALQRYAPAHASASSYNNHWGVPLSLARMPRGAAFGVFELGMNHAGEIGPLARLVRPRLAIITNVEPVHLEYFDSVTAIADAKAEIFEGLEKGGIAVLNRDNAFFGRLADAARARGAGQVIGFGESDSAEARLIKAVAHPDCTCVSADICGQPMTYKIGVPGHHWVMNSLAVLASVQALGGDLGLAGLALAELTPPEGRGNRTRVELDTGGFEIVDESYNANPVSVAAAISSLGALRPEEGARRIAVLGDMLELGPDAPKFHTDLAAPLAEAGIDLVFTAGPDMRRLSEALPKRMRGGHGADSAEAAANVTRAVRAGDIVMVKGSLGSRMRLVVEALKDLETMDRRARAANGAGK